MSKRNHLAEAIASGQQSLLDTSLAEGSLDLSLGLKQMHSQQLKGLCRWTVAAQISKATGIEISKDMLDKRLSSDPSYQPYTIHTLAISAITGDLQAFEYLLKPLGSDVLDPADRDLIELARIQEKMKILDEQRLQILKRRNLEVKP